MINCLQHTKLLQYQRNDTRYYYLKLINKKTKYTSIQKAHFYLCQIMRRIFQIFPVVLLFAPLNLHAQSIKDSYSSSSKLSHGIWFRIAITSDGIYRIDFSKLKQLGLADPSNPRIFGNNFGQLSYYNDDPKPDDLKEISIQLNSGIDGIFNEGDYLLFYGQSTGRWNYNQVKNKYDYLPHNYSDTAFYFITSDQVPGKAITSSIEPSLPADYISSESDVLFVHEQDDENLIRSGRDWFQPLSSVHIDPGFTDLLTSENIKYDIRVAARASIPTIFRIYEGSLEKKNIDIQAVNLYDDYGSYAQISDSSGSMQPHLQIRCMISNSTTMEKPALMVGLTG